MSIKNKLLRILSCTVLAVMLSQTETKAQILEIITQATKKVIRQIDLKVQKLQNKTIWLQNAQKTIENKMAELKLKEISGWTQRQRDLFRDYYDELSNVKAAISTYSKAREVISLQLRIADEYRAGFNLAKQDSQFKPEEIEAMYQVYTGIIEASLKNLDELYMIISPYKMQMSDAKRIELVGNVSVKMQHCLDDLRKFNERNRQISFQRRQLHHNNEIMKGIHGLK